MTCAEKPVPSFEAAARAFCALLDGGLEGSTADLESLTEALAELYQLAVQLPREGVDHAPSLPAGLGLELQIPAELDSYYEVFDPRMREAPVAGSLRDDLTEIWADLSCGLQMHDLGAIPEALAYWRWSFEDHWGAHLLSSLRLLHFHLKSRWFQSFLK